VLDEVARPKVVEGAFDEIFVGRQPVLMGVEPASLCWVLGQLVEHCDGPSWSEQFQKFPALEHAITDAGKGLVNGLKLAQGSYSKRLQHSLDVFHTLRVGGRAWRAAEAFVWHMNDKALRAQKRAQRLRRQGVSLKGHAALACRVFYKAERMLESTIAVETAWQQAQEALELFTPEAQLNTVAAARAKLEQALPALPGARWEKTIRLLRRPQALTFLERIERQLQELPIAEDLKQDALRFEGLRRRPKLLEGEELPARANRASCLIANLRYQRDETFQQAVESVRGILRHCWRASSLVEGINSVVRMQQARHRKLTPGLLDLKRFYWNCRRFRTGRRRNRSPYELLGINVPAGSWWNLLKLSPTELRQQLSSYQLAA